MNSKFLVSIALACLAFAACDDTTENIGTSLTTGTDGVSVQSAVFDVISRSVAADSVLSRNAVGYLGKVRDPETGAYITGDFMAQFNNLENFSFPALDSLVTYDAEGNQTFGNKGTIRADSCEIRLYIDDYYGDSRQTMKLTAYEMGKAMNEDRLYYSNFDPASKGYIRQGGVRKDKVYNLTDYNVPESERDTTTYTPYITIKLDGKYTDGNGRSYNNYGAYVLQKYYDDPSNFKNAYTFRNNVVPGFLFKLKSGLGNMAKIKTSQLNVYFKNRMRIPHTDKSGGSAVTTYKDTILNQVAVFWGTEEVLQTTTITNDKETIGKLVADESCTYLKTPAGIFTELTLPVESILRGHEADTIVSAKLVLPRLNNNGNSDYAFEVPKNVLMVPKDSLYSFFENNRIYNNKASYAAAWGHSGKTQPADNSYVFNNVSGLISAMKSVRDKSENWNKVVVIPVLLSTSQATSSSGTQTATVTKVSNDMSLTSTRLAKGTATNSPIKISVIYSKIR